MSARPLSVVLIGGTGFIGQHLAARLSDDGVKLLVPVRHDESAKQLTMLPGVDVANIHDDLVLRKLLAGRDAVINLVGVLHGGHGRPYGEGFRHLHVDLPRRIAAGRERHVLGLPDRAARLQAGLFELLPGQPIISRDNLDSMLVDNVAAADTRALTAEALGIKLTAIESVAPHYLTRHNRLDDDRSHHAGR